MKHVIRLPQAIIEASVEVDPMRGITIRVEMGDAALSLGLHRIDARKLGEALVNAADEMGNGRENDHA